MGADWRCAALLALLLVTAAGCYYEDPYAKHDAEVAERPVLQRAFTGVDVGADGLAHTPLTRFVAGSQPTLTVALSGKGRARVQSVLLTQEGGRNLDVVQALVDVRGPTMAGLPLGAMLDGLAPGEYYLSIVVDGVPSWGIPLVIAANAGQTDEVRD